MLYKESEMSLNKINCLNQLFKKLHCRVEILDFLVLEKVINSDTMAHIINEQQNTHPQLIFSLLEKLQKEDKLQLVDYEWSLLPKEFIKLTIVTDNSKKEFIYSI
jgi:hypothetical protein